MKTLQRFSVHFGLSCVAISIAAADPIKRSFAACAIALNDDISELYLPLGPTSVEGESEWLKVPLNELTVGAPLEYHGPANLRFFANPAADAKPVATINLAASTSSMLLVFLPNPVGDGYRIIAIADSDFPFGSYYFQNLSPHPVAVDLDGKKHLLDPGKSAVEPASPDDDQEVRIHASIQGKTRLIKSTSWRLDAEQRELVFFHTPPGSGRVATKHILSIRPAQQP